ncbi:MAG: NUDIX domain-containing protein [Bacteroidota bacterium]
MTYVSKEKVLAYILRQFGENREILVFRHTDFPEAGLQVPAGTVEVGEEKHVAMLREVKEESGLSTFDKVQFLGSTRFVAEAKQEIHHRHYYQLDFSLESPARFEHRVSGKGIDAQMLFAYEWQKLDQLPPLAVVQDEMISKIKR